MNRHFKWDKKYLYWGITAFCVVACAILFYMALNYMPGVLSAIGSLFSILSPFIWGLAITYILLPLVKSLQRGAFGALGKAIHKKKPEKAQRFARAMSVLLVGDNLPCDHRRNSLPHNPSLVSASRPSSKTARPT